MQTILAGILRHVLTAGGGALVTNGLLTSGQAEQAIGAIVTLIGIAWSVWAKRAAAPTV